MRRSSLLMLCLASSLAVSACTKSAEEDVDRAVAAARDTDPLGVWGPKMTWETEAGHDATPPAQPGDFWQQAGTHSTSGGPGHYPDEPKWTLALREPIRLLSAPPDPHGPGSSTSRASPTLALNTTPPQPPQPPQANGRDHCDRCPP